MGTLNRRADIVLRDGKGNFIAIAECKSSYGAALKSYLSASDTRFGLLATSPNRDEWVYCERRGGNRFVEIEQTVFEAGILGERQMNLNHNRMQNPNQNPFVSGDILRLFH